MVADFFVVSFAARAEWSLPAFGEVAETERGKASQIKIDYLKL